jgi:hypothetical protein
VPRLLHDQANGDRERLDVGSGCRVSGELGELLAEGENDFLVAPDFLTQVFEVGVDSFHGEELSHRMPIAHKLCAVEEANTAKTALFEVEREGKQKNAGACNNKITDNEPSKNRRKIACILLNDIAMTASVSSKK